eukprot:gene30255-36561_t
MVAQKDFKKKKAKIGRKVQSGKATKINVQSKQIVLSSQHFGGESVNKNFQLQHVISELKHSNHNIKLEGLNELENALRRHQEEVCKHLPTLVPYIFELVLSDESKVRTGAVGFLARLFGRPKDCEGLGGLLQLMVSFVCSALSSLSKGVRRDGLLVLRDIVQRFDVDAQLDKVLASLLLIAQDPSLLLAMHTSTSSAETQRAIPNTLGILSVLPSSGTKNSKVSKKKRGEKLREQRSFLQTQADGQHLKKSTFACLLEALLAIITRRGDHKPLRVGGRGMGGLTLECAATSRSLCLHSLPLHLCLAKDSQISGPVEACASSATAACLASCLLQHFGALSRGGEVEGHDADALSLLHKVASAVLGLLRDNEVRCLVFQKVGDRESVLQLVSGNEGFPFFARELARHREADAQYAAHLLAAEQLNLMLCEMSLLAAEELPLPAVITGYLAELVGKCHARLHHQQGLREAEESGKVGQHTALEEAYRQLFGRVLALSPPFLSQCGSQSHRDGEDKFTSSLLTSIGAALSSPAPSAALAPLLLTAASEFVDSCVPWPSSSMQLSTARRSGGLLRGVFGIWAHVPRYLHSLAQTPFDHQFQLDASVLQVVRCLRRLLLFAEGSGLDLHGEAAELAGSVVAYLFASPFLHSLDKQGVLHLLDLLACMPASDSCVSLLAQMHARVRALEDPVAALDRLYGVLLVCLQTNCLDFDSARQVLRQTLRVDLTSAYGSADKEDGGALLKVAASHWVSALDAGLLTIHDAYFAVRDESSMASKSSSSNRSSSSTVLKLQLRFLVTLLRNCSADKLTQLPELLPWMCALCGACATHALATTIAAAPAQEVSEVALQYAGERASEEGLQDVLRLLCTLCDRLGAAVREDDVSFYAAAFQTTLDHLLVVPLESMGASACPSLSQLRQSLDVFVRLVTRVASHAVQSKARLGAGAARITASLGHVVGEGRERALQSSAGGEEQQAMLLAMYAEMQYSIGVLA